MYSDQTLFDEPTRAVMNVTSDPATLVISQLIPADSGGETSINRYEIYYDKRLPVRGGIKVLTVCVPGLIVFNQAAAAGPRSGGVQTGGGL